MVLHDVAGAAGEATLHDGGKRLRVDGLELSYDVFNVAALSFQVAVEDLLYVPRRPYGNAADHDAFVGDLDPVDSRDVARGRLSVARRL